MFPRDPKLEKQRRLAYSDDFHRLFDEITSETEELTHGEKYGEKTVEKTMVQ